MIARLILISRFISRSRKYPWRRVLPVCTKPLDGPEHFVRSCRDHDAVCMMRPLAHPLLLVPLVTKTVSNFALGVRQMEQPGDQKH
jgi:hypothetical protein